MKTILLFSLFFATLSTAHAGKIALVQYNGDIHFGDRTTNLQNLTAIAETAVQSGANIIVFPEGSILGYSGGTGSGTEIWCKPRMTSYPIGSGTARCRDVSTAAENVPTGSTTLYWKNFAITNGVYILFPIIESKDSKFFNALVSVSPTGEVLSYHKRALYIVDKAYATAGNRPLVVDTPYGRFGLMICMDGLDSAQENSYFGYYNEYKRLGVNRIIISMDWDDDPNDSTIGAQYYFRRRAKEFRVDIYASDVSTWDGTGKYKADGSTRERYGLPPYAAGIDGVSIHDL